MNRGSARYVSDRMVSFNRIVVEQHVDDVTVTICDDDKILTATNVPNGDGDALFIDFHDGFIRLEVK